MGKLPAIQFYPGDWLRDPVATCSLAAQGLWLRMMFIAHDCVPYGYIAQQGKRIPDDRMAKMCHCVSVEEFLTLLAELDHAGVPSRGTDGIIYSRRMVRDAKRREESRRYGKRGGNPAITTHSNPPVKGGVKGGVNPPRRGRRKGNRSSGLGVPGEGFDALVPDSLRTPKFLAAWKAWLEYRENRKPAYTEEAAKRALPKLEDEGADAAVDRIDRSIINGWQGLFFQGEKNSSSGSARNETPKEFGRRIAAESKDSNGCDTPS